MGIASIGSVGCGAPASSADGQMPDEIEGEIMAMSQSQMKTEGAAVVRMITDAAQAVNRPLAEGPVGRRINIGV